MGNQHGNGRRKSSPTGSTTETANQQKTQISRSVSGNDIQEKATTINLESLQRLGKVLSERAKIEDGVNGITLNVFTKYLFPKYPVLSDKLFAYFHKLSKSKTTHIGTLAFMQQCDRFLQILDDETISDVLVKIFSVQNVENNNEISTDSLKSLLMSSYQISMDHYCEGPQSCFSLHQTLKAVTDSCFHTKNALSSSYVSHWLQTNCPRLLQPLHRYIVHSLATSYRTLEEQREPDLAAGLELATPVLDKAPPVATGKCQHPHVLTMSMSWLLASALPQLYSQPRKANSPNGSSNGLSSMTFMAKMLSAIPSHWLLIYDSDENGLGANRFLHHTLAYKGPTLVLLKTNEGHVFCIACPDEWHESHQYWSREEAALYQILPKFCLLGRGTKMLYLNFTARGYPHGLRAGNDPRAPVISIDGGFEKIEHNKIPDKLITVEVWGCGDPVSRTQQLEVKKWEVKEAERQRVVKMSAADWIDHPDRYLLELAGRPQYSSK